MFGRKKRTFADHISDNWPLIASLAAFVYISGQQAQSIENLRDDVNSIEISLQKILLDDKGL